jgi:HlyD family type I secretion membrane fusion protein
MRNDLVLDLADCTEFRQTLQARPPRIVHGTTGLLVALLGTALVWSAATRANLVVRAPGRVRPVTTPTKVYSAAQGEVLSAGVGGRVVEVNVREGDRVRKGDLLIRLETERLDNEIAKQTRVLRDAREELTQLGRLEELMTGQFEAARAKADAELAQARQEVRRAEDQQGAEVRLVQVELDTADDDERRLRVLVSRRAAPRADLIKAELKAREAREKIAKARLPLDRSRVAVAERARELVEHDHAVKLGELRLKSAAKRGEVEAARIELANRELERRLAEIRAPMDGVVIKGDVKVGDILEPGKSVVELAQQEGFVFEGSVASEDVGHLRVGMEARIKLDAFDYQRYGTAGGTVRFLSPDSGVAWEGRTITYTVRVALTSDEVGRGQFRGRVRLGMTGQVEIVTGHESVLSLLVKQIRRTISLG